MSSEILKILCSTVGCGNLLTQSSLIKLSYPNDVTVIRDLLKNGVNHIYCNNCRCVTDLDGNGTILFLEKLNQVIIYTSPLFGLENPDFKKSIVNEFPEGATFQYIDDVYDFQFKVIASILKSVYPAYEEFFNLAYGGDKAALIDWLSKHFDKLDKEFFAVSYLIQEKVIPFLVIVSESKEAFQDREMLRKMARTFQLVVGIVDSNAGSQVQKTKIEKEIRKKIEVVIDESIKDFLVMIAIKFSKTREIKFVDNVVANILPKGIVSNDRIKQLCEISDKFEKNGELGSFFCYCFNALIAALCDYGEIENPCQSRWVNYYMTFELTKFSTQENTFFENNGVSDEFARRTLTPELVWNFYSYLMNKREAQSQTDDFEEIITNVDKIVKRLGWEAQFAEFFIKAIHFSEKVEPEEEADIYFGMLNRSNIPKMAIRVFLSNKANGNIDRFVQLIQYLRKKFFEVSKYELGIWISCRASEELNLRFFHQLSKNELESCKKELKEREIWPPTNEEIYIDFLTEYGNSLRYSGNPNSALEQYDLCRKLICIDYSDYRFRVNERNRAIALREMMQIGASLLILDSLLSHAETYAEKSSILNSISVAYRLIGQIDMAIKFLKEALRVVPEGRALEGERLLPLLNLAALMDSSEPQVTYDVANEAMEIAERQNNHWVQAMASGLIARSSDKLDFPSNKRKTINTIAIQLLEQIIVSDSEKKIFTIYDQFLLELLSDRLEAAGDLVKAERILEQALDSRLVDGGQSWTLYANLSRFALKRHDLKLAHKYLVQAKRSSTSFVSKIHSSRDPIELMSDKTTLQNTLAEVYLSEYPNNVSDEELRSAADFQTSVAWSSNFLRKMNLKDSEYEEDIFYEASYLANSILDEKTVIVQIISTTSNIYLLITKTEAGKVVLKISPVELNPQIRSQLVEQVMYKLSTARPNCMEDPLQKLDNWKAFITSVDRAFRENIPPKSHICIIPGPLSGLPLHYASTDEYFFSYAPSLMTICLLRHEKILRFGHKPWRPRSMHDFMTWRIAENPLTITAFQNASHILKCDIKKHFIEYTSSKGVNATKGNLLEALARTDSIKISCHGRTKLDELKFEWIIAANGQLPPQDIYALDSEMGEQFLLNWDELEGISKSPPIVFSTACASGMSLSVNGGERLGLERHLFNAGTLSYVAPQWPVPVGYIQKLMNFIINDYFGNPNTTLSKIVYNLLKSSFVNEIPEWVTKSIVIIGDWL
jgi:hypothetical protein